MPILLEPDRYPQRSRTDNTEWQSVISVAAELGVLQVGFSGGEPLVRQDLPELIEAARGAGLYTNLITSGVGLDENRAAALRGAGLIGAIKFSGRH